MKIFVYGTLKRGYSNNHLLQTATFVGTGQTIANCRMLQVGFPVLRRRSKTDGQHNAPVRGEVYECDANTVARLDRLEGNGHMYHRKTKLIRLDDGKVIKAQAYVGDTKFWRHRYADHPPVSNGVHDWYPRHRAA